tara:strand:+ start:70 stop:1125 length:1056 start_codon:yes stop_codon:yes gene_type:complete
MTHIITDEKEAFSLLKIVSDQQRQRRDKHIEETVKLTEGLELPWADHLRDDLSIMMYEQSDQVLTHHPGKELFTRWQSITNLLDILRANHKDLIAALDEFHNEAQEPGFFSRLRKEQFDSCTLEINKCMYNVVSTLVAIHELTRKLEGKFNPDGYEDRFNAIYGKGNDLYWFLRGLRNVLNHEHFSQAGYSIRQTQSLNETEFVIHSNMLLNNSVSLNDEARAFIQKQGKTISIRPVIETHCKHVQDFYAWVEGQLKNDIRYSDYETCSHIYKHAAAQTWWSILLKQLEAKGFDPYEHLENHFNTKEIEEIKSLPHRSRAQVDKMIQLYDNEKVCSDNLRERIYKLCKATK